MLLNRSLYAQQKAQLSQCSIAVKTEFELNTIGIKFPMNVAPRHYGMARPQIADGGTASYMEGSCEYIE
jgi:hypothetical protein